MNPQILQYKKDLEDYVKTGKIKDPALFWAAKMSQIISLMETAPLVKISEAFDLLKQCKDEYDDVIFSRMTRILKNEQDKK